jgi:hypothetical protein
MATVMALELVAMIATRESAPRTVSPAILETINVELAGHAETRPLCPALGPSQTDLFFWHSSRRQKILRAELMQRVEERAP